MTPQTSDLQLIPLNRLVQSQANVRKTDRKGDIDALAASIASHGLLQNLSVTPLERGRYAVVAGGRRLLALKRLARAGTLAQTFAVPCLVLDGAAGREASLVENVHRVAMHPMDEVEAFSALTGEGLTPLDIAHRFGIGVRQVDQRLALARLSPKIRAACRRGELTLDVAKAFCLVDDHGRQDAVFRSLRKPITQPGQVRGRLMEGRMRADDRLVRFVGRDAYEQSGGQLVQDLFEDTVAYVSDPGLVHKLAADRLEQEREKLLLDGWSWVESDAGGGAEALGHLRLAASWRDLTEAEASEIDRLEAEMEALDAALEIDGADDDPRWSTRDDIAGQIGAIRQNARTWDAALMAHAGVVLAIGHDGDIAMTAGLVRKTDEKAFKAMQRLGTADEVEPSADRLPEAVEPQLPKALIRDISTARARALRQLLSQDGETALAIAVAALLSRVCLRTEFAGVGLSASLAYVEDTDATLRQREATFEDTPEDADTLLDWCLCLPMERLLGLFAMLVSGSLDLVHERGGLNDERRRRTADRLAVHFGLDMTAFWSPDLDYWSRLPKQALLDALSDSPNLIDASDRKRSSVLAGYAKLRKDDLAAAAAKAYANTPYLPDLLVTPSNVSLTSSGQQAAAA